MITDYLTDSLVLSRRSNDILIGVDVAATIQVVAQPARAAYIELSLANATSGGIVYVNGTSGGVAATEGVAIPSGSNIRRTLAAFTSISSLTLSGVAGGSISARAVAGGGEPVASEVAEERFAGAISAQSGRLRYLQQGSDMIADYKLSRIYSDKVAERKIVTNPATGKRYEIMFVSQVGPHGNVLCDLHLLP